MLSLRKENWKREKMEREMDVSVFLPFLVKNGERKNDGMSASLFQLLFFLCFAFVPSCNRVRKRECGSCSGGEQGG